MSNHERSHPEYFEELCALAGSGQISEAEFVELQDHVQQCADCKSTYTDFMDLLHNKLPLADPAASGSTRFFSESSSYRERFLARARKSGLAISPARSRDNLRSKLVIWFGTRLRYSQVAALAMALLLAVVAILGYSLRESNARYRTVAADLAAVQKSISQQPSAKNVVQEDQSAKLSPQEAVPPPAALPSPSVKGAELVKARQDHATAEARANALEEQLQSVALELETFRKEQEEASISRDQLEKKLMDAEQLLTRADDELQKIRRGRSDDAVTIATQDLQIRQLTENLAEQTEILERERTLLAAGRDIHDLMGARNLHIVDVLDVDSKGKDKRAFGRVFYTEEKSLIFYAFDLADRNTTKRNASFQVWGARGPTQNPAKSLGIFYVDDQKQNRWLLKFEDPSVLAEIDSVFVTIEPPGGSAKPTGSKFLYAYLKANPNHP
jgi:hypothetical protein